MSMADPVAGVIDLGSARDLPDPDLLRPPRRGPRRVPRRVGVLAVVLAALALVAGSAPPRVSVSRARFAADLGATVLLTGGRLFVVSPYRVTPDALASTVTGYRLPGGRQLWQVPVPPGNLREVETAPGVLLLTVEQASAIQVETVAVDADTGRIRWRSPYLVVGRSSSGRLLLAGAQSARPGLDVDRLVALDPRTGAAAWSYPVPEGAWHDLEFHPGSQALAGGDPGGSMGRAVRSVLVEPSGRVTVRDLETGQVRATGRLGGDLAAALAASSRLELAGGLLLAAGPGGHGSTITAYGVPGLERRWQVPGDFAGGSVSADCAGGLCWYSRRGGLRVLDPDSGVTRFTARRWEHAQTLGTGLLARAWRPPATGGTAAVLDPVTGRIRLDLGRWEVLGPARPDGTVPAVRREPATGRVSFALLDVAGLTIQVLGSATGVSGDCLAGRGPDLVLVCRRLDASVGAWTYHANHAGATAVDLVSGG